MQSANVETEAGLSVGNSSDSPSAAFQEQLDTVLAEQLGKAYLQAIVSSLKGGRKQ